MCTRFNSAALIGIIHEGKPTNCYLGKKIEKSFQFSAICILILRDICVRVCVCARQIWEVIWFDHCKGRQCEPKGCQLANFSIYSQFLITSTRLHEDKPLLVKVAGKLIQ